MAHDPAIPFRARNLDWIINVDFLPILSLQAELDSRQEIYYMKAHVSEITSVKVDSGIYSDLRIEISDIPSNAKKTEIKWGSKNPADEERTTQKELWEEIRSIIQIPEACIKNRGVTQSIPKMVENFPVFEGADKIFSYHTAFGNRSRALRQRLGLRLANPYYIIRGELINREIIHSTQNPVLKRIKSVLATSYLQTDTTQGYDPLFPHALYIQRGLRGNKFWKDTAIPNSIQGRVDSSKLEAILYRLDTRKESIIAL